MITLDRWAWFIGEISRPLSICVGSFAASVASVIVSLRVENGNDGALVIAACFAGVSALYGFKAVEVARVARSDADVRIAESEAKK